MSSHLQLIVVLLGVGTQVKTGSGELGDSTRGARQQFTGRARRLLVSYRNLLRVRNQLASCLRVVDNQLDDFLERRHPPFHVIVCQTPSHTQCDAE